jgi:hypothetical protein
VLKAAHMSAAGGERTGEDARRDSAPAKEDSGYQEGGNVGLAFCVWTVGATLDLTLRLFEVTNLSPPRGPFPRKASGRETPI